MSKEMSIIVLGAAVIIVPYLGVPASWRTLLLVLAGITLVVIGFLLRARGMNAGTKSSYSTFVENIPAGQAGDVAHAAQNSHESHKEGITSLN